MNYLVNYPDSAQAVASSQFNKHFLSTHYPQCSQWAIVTLPAGGREVIRQIQDAQQEPLLAVGARQELGMVTGAHREPSHLCWQSKGSSLSHRVCPLLPSPCLDLHPRPLLLPSSLLRVSGLTRPSRFPRECPDHPQDVFIVKMRPKLGPVCVSACFLTGFLSTFHPLYSGNIRRGVSF